MTIETGTRFESAALKNWVTSILTGRGLPDEDAAAVADALVETDMRGVHTHGVTQLPLYLSMLDRGVTNASPDIRIEGQGGFLRMQADRALGQVAGRRAIDAAIAAVKTHGLIAMTIAQSGHLGALGYFTRVLAENGMIAILMQNGPPLMSLPGAQRRSIGNNPISFAAPVAGRPPIVFDVATSEAAFGKLIRRADDRIAIPEGWAIDKDGLPTTDARAAMAGMLLPAGGIKGIGIAMMIEILAGSLTATRPEWGAGIFGGFLIVIDPVAALERAAFDAHVATWLEHFEGSHSEARYPGQRAAALFADALRNGVPISPDLYQQLTALEESKTSPLPAAL